MIFYPSDNYIRPAPRGFFVFSWSCNLGNEFSSRYGYCTSGFVYCVPWYRYFRCCKFYFGPKLLKYLCHLYLLLVCFQFMFVSDRHATSTSIRDMLSFISSRVNTSLDISSLPTSWNMRRNIFDIFLYILSPNARLWCMYWYVLCYNWREDAVCEFIDGWEEVKVRLFFCFVEGWVDIWSDGIGQFGLLSSSFYDVYTLDEMLCLRLSDSWLSTSLCIRMCWVLINSN